MQLYTSFHKQLITDWLPPRLCPARKTGLVSWNPASFNAIRALDTACSSWGGLTTLSKKSTRSTTQRRKSQLSRICKPSVSNHKAHTLCLHWLILCKSLFYETLRFPSVLTHAKWRCNTTLTRSGLRLLYFKLYFFINSVECFGIYLI